MKLPKVESIIITVFFLCIALWAISKCSSRRSQIVQGAREAVGQEDRPLRHDTVIVPKAQTPVQPEPQIQQPQTYATPQPAPTTGGGLPKLQNQPAATAPPVPGVQPALSNQPQTTPPAAPPAPQYSTLYVTIDGLKMRKEPGLKGALVTKLDLYEPVYFLNKKSEKPEEISLGYEKVTDYWVKVRTKSGKEGWVFGAGVHYYKMKRKGVME